MTNPDPLFTTKEAAAYIGISPQSLERYRLSGVPQIPHIKYPGLRGAVRYRKSDLDQFLASSVRRTTSDRGAA